MLEIVELRRDGLAPLSLKVDRGECVALRGASGAGKTLLLRAIADLDPNEGRVSLLGRDRSSVPGPQWRRMVGYLPAEPGWWAETVAEHFENWDQARDLIERLGLPGDAGSWPVSRPSTGERQRLALVRALMAAPLALLLDEPTAALDPGATALVETMILERVAKGLIVIWVSHDAAQAARVASCRQFILDGGGIREERS